MARHFAIVIALLLNMAAEAQTAGPARVASGREARAVAIYTPPPDYPLEARQRRLTGRGMVLVEVDKKTGYVVAGRMLKSTGHTILDNAALRAFKLWRFKPGTVERVRMPIHFTTRRNS